MCVLTTLLSAGEGGAACLETWEQSLFTNAMHLYLGLYLCTLVSRESGWLDGRSFTLFLFLVLICVAWTTAAPLLAHLPHSGRWRGCRSVGAPLLGMIQKSQWFPPLNLGCQKIAWQDSNSPTARTDSEFPVSNFRFVYLQVDLRKDLHVRKFVFEIIIIQVFIKRKLLSVETIFKAHSKRAFA